MSDKTIPMPKAAFVGLDLHDGDIVEGRAGGESVELRIVRHSDGTNGPMTGERFVAKWRGQFPDVPAGGDPPA